MMGYVLAFGAGIILGLLFFGGLYITIQKLETAKNPALIMILSFILRMVVLVISFYFISKSGYKEVLFALAGVILTRFVMTFRMRGEKKERLKRGD
ncbi:MAG: ATP synthase subunit I [Gudongella sp.]|nr:ATP synthase subunit I [Gudongella sp.]